MDILIVDDSELIALALRRLMRERGLTVDVARSYSEAWSSATSNDFSVALIDLSLSDWGGLELAKRLLKDDLVARVFFVSTELCDPQVRERAAQLGSVFRKGCPGREVIAAIAEALRAAPQRSGVTRVARPAGDGEAPEGSEASG